MQVKNINYNIIYSERKKSTYWYGDENTTDWYEDEKTTDWYRD